MEGVGRVELADEMKGRATSGIQPGASIEGFDLARALAFLGMVFVNFRVGAGDRGGEPALAHLARYAARRPGRGDLRDPGGHRPLAVVATGGARRATRWRWPESAGRSSAAPRSCS